MCVCVCMYVCMYVYMYVCMYVCMHVCMYACKKVCMYVCMYICMYVNMYVCNVCVWGGVGGLDGWMDDYRIQIDCFACHWPSGYFVLKKPPQKKRCLAETLNLTDRSKREIVYCLFYDDIYIIIIWM